MALIHTGSIVSQIRGSVGTETYSRNSAGPYVRERKGPEVNTGENRVACRDAMTALSQAWSNTLTDQQRTDWRMYAHQHPHPNRWGERSGTAGHCCFIRHNWYLYELTEMLIYVDAPEAPGCHPPTFIVSADSVTNTVSIVIPPENYDPPPENVNLFAYIGYEQNPGVNFAPNKWRRWSANFSMAGDWFLDPWTAEYPDTLHSGQKLWMKLLAQYDLHGELSTPHIASCIVNPFDNNPNHDPDWKAKAITRLELLIAACPPDKPRRLAALQHALERMQG